MEEKIKMKSETGPLSKIFFIIQSLTDIVSAVAHFILPGLLPRFTHVQPRLAKGEEDEFGVHRRGGSGSAKSDLNMPKNAFEILLRGRDLSGNGPCIGTRPLNGKYTWLTYQDVIDRATDFGAGLVSLGCKTDCEYLIGIMAKTSLGWTLAEYGCLAYGMTTAPLHDSLGPEACQEAVNICDIEIMVCGGDEQVTVLLNDGKYPMKLRTIITLTNLSPNLLSQLADLKVKVLTLEEVQELGARNPRPRQLASEYALASLVFTSGTTGAPKGAMLTHSCFMLAINSFLKSNEQIQLTTEDSFLGIFPLSHISERLCEKIVHLHGAKIAYLSGDIRNLLSDAQELRPTLFFFVPRIMNRFYDEIYFRSQKSLLGRILLPIALAAKQRDMENGIFSKDTIWDKLIFGKCQAMLGGRVRYSYTGSATSDGKVLNFMRAAFGCYIYELYGQTECGGQTTTTVYGDLTTGHVGIPFKDVEVKLVDVPDLGYFTTDRCGEICTRSKLNMIGYYRMPEKTVDTIDCEGWLHTGDVGKWTEDGKLQIIDRKKHIFKLSQGEYLSPERIEGILSRSRLVTNLFVDGDSKYPYCVALIYPNYEVLQASPDDIKHEKGTRKSPKEMEIREKIMADMKRLGKEGKLKSYEIPQKIAFLQQPFSQENSCLTVSHKIKRDNVRKIHRSCIAGLYDSA